VAAALLHAVLDFGSESAAQQPAPGARFNVGYQTRELSYSLPDGSSKQLTLAIWYPTQAEPQPYRYRRKLIPARVAVDAALYMPDVAYPLVLLSHGRGGCGTSSAYLAEHLAARGYIVAAPDHEDAFLCSIEESEAVSWKPDSEDAFIVTHAHRVTDLRAALDEMFRLNRDASSTFYRGLDEGRIGVAGHSLGGWTSEVISGAIQGYRDERIAAALLLAPADDQFGPEEFQRIGVPVMHIVGEHEMFGRRTGATESFAYDQGRPPKFLAVVKNADHLAFADFVCIGSRSIEDCQSSNSKAAVILKYAGAFIDFYLKNDQAAVTTLGSGDPGLTSYYVSW
jgi:predicted dienelactone hydrolase